MPSDTAAGAAAATARKEREEQELKLLEEVVRQAEVRLTALAQTRQMIATKATTVTGWMLTLLVVVTTGLVSITANSHFVQTKGALLLLGYGALSATLLGIVALAVIGASSSQHWHYAGANPRRFFPSITRMPTLVQRVAGHLQKRPEKSSLVQFGAPQSTVSFQTKKEVLRDTVERYAQAIDRTELNLLKAQVAIVWALGVALAPTGLGLIHISQSSDILLLLSWPAPPSANSVGPSTSPPSAAPPPATPPAIPDTPPPNPMAPSNPEPRKPN